MKRSLFFLIPLLAFIVLAAFLLRGLWLNPSEVPSPLIGKPAPQFETPKLAAPGEKFSNRDMLGKVWILNVWASWCGPCREEHPIWNDFSRKNLVPVVGLNYKDQDETAVRWLREQGNPYAVSIADHDGRVGIDYGVYGVPETFVIDRTGVIRYKHIGPMTKTVLEEKIIPELMKLGGRS
ncbi:MAG TPA: DsbE family thiol:disulfide interchange protein [Burkholderiaceae bacterium]|nr:DsbE family thiol:disulfide interchange protein [Burkholderiaceae bacterium]